MKRKISIILISAMVLLFSQCSSAPEGKEEPVTAFAKPVDAVSRPEASADGESGGISADETSKNDDKAYADAERSLTTEESGFAAKEKEAGTPAEGTAIADAKSPDLSDTMSSGAKTEEAIRPSTSGLKAGFEDDNQQYNYFIHFLDEYNYEAQHIPLDVSERIFLDLTDKNGRSIPNAEITITADGKKLVSGRTHADGTYQFNPSEYSGNYASYNAEINADGFPAKKIKFERNGERTVKIKYDSERIIKEPIPLDILFIMDTTGSMGEEIDRLKLTIELIYLNLSSLPNDVILRFGMVLYKDRYDSYNTEIIPLTADLDKFQDQLSGVEASGGGDQPEDLQQALSDTINGIDWNMAGNAVKLAFIITDAPPHLDYRDQKYKYTDAIHDARAAGIKIHSIGTGGLDINGEYVLRQIAQYTGGKYIFLTYGESGESTGGKVGSVSHHTGSNYQTDKFESIIIHTAKEEIGYLSSTPLPADDPYIEARKIEDEEKSETLTLAFRAAMEQLIDFSSYKISSSETLAVLPIVDETGRPETAEYFTQQFVFSASGNKSFTLVERGDLNALFDEIKLQLSGITEGKNIDEVGELLDADYLVSTQMYKKETQYELFIKLLRVKTGEVLSVTKTRLDEKLGL